MVARVVFETEAEVVARLLPPGFAPAAEASVAFEVQNLTQVDWLAGRSYSTLGVKIPAIFQACDGDVQGDFLAVLWENLADPILSGREELGYAKLWCDIEESARSETGCRFAATWLGHPFTEIELEDLEPSRERPPAAQPLLHYKYVPRTGCPGQADAAYATITPSANPDLVVEKRLTGKGRVSFRRSTWEQLPTLFHIVNALADIPLGNFRTASLTFSRGGKDLSDVHILEAR